MTSLADDIINHNIEVAKNRTRTQKITSFVKTKARSALGSTATLSSTTNARSVVGILAPKIAAKLLSSIPVVGAVVGSLGEAAAKYFANKHIQENSLGRADQQMGKWVNALAKPHDTARFLQDISHATFKDVIPAMNDAMHKLETARKDLQTKSKEVEKKLAPLFDSNLKPIKFEDALEQINQLAYAYGYYLHRYSRLRMYMDSVQAFMFQYEEGYEVFQRDIQQSQVFVTDAIEKYTMQLENTK
jgi:hypothetical protein